MSIEQMENYSFKNGWNAALVEIRKLLIEARKNADEATAMSEERKSGITAAFDCAIAEADRLTRADGA